MNPQESGCITFWLFYVILNWHTVATIVDESVGLTEKSVI